MIFRFRISYNRICREVNKMGTSMSQEVKECLQDDDVDMCMKQIEEILSSVEEAKDAIRDSYYRPHGCGTRECGISTSLYKDDIEFIQRIDAIWSRTKQLESMMKYSFDFSKRKETEAKCITPWFFMVGAFLILCKKKM